MALCEAQVFGDLYGQLSASSELLEADKVTATSSNGAMPYNIRMTLVCFITSD